MKSRSILAGLLVMVLLTGSLAPLAGAQGPGGAAETVQPAQGPSLDELQKQLAEGLITEKEFDRLAPVQSCGPEAVWPGPDGFGYVGSLVTYDWVDITTTGTPIPGLTDDSYAGPFPLGFTFSFYGTGWTEFYAGSNGLLTFGAGSTSLSNQCPLPNSSTPNNVVALLWDDLNFNVSGSAYYQTFDPCPLVGGGGICTVVEYYNVAHYGGSAGSAGTWEAIFNDDGEVIIQFLDAGVEEGSGSTTGIENNNAAADWGLAYACNVAGSITDGLAIKFGVPTAPRFDDSSKHAPAQVLPGEPIEYEVTIYNSGNAPGLETTMVDPIPAGTIYNGDVACSSGSCYYDAGTNAVYWEGEVATPPKGEWKPPAAPGGRQAKGPDVPAKPTVDPAVVPQAPKLTTAVLLDQQPNQANGYFSDANCDWCGGPQVLAENFALAGTTTLEQIALWGGFYSADLPGEPDAIRVLIHQDAAGLPGAVVYDESNIAYSRVQTGVVLLGVHEWLHTLTLGTPAVLPAGNYWVEIYFTTGVGDYSDYFWETGNPDTYGRGLPDAAVAFEAPGVSWFYPIGTELAFQLIGTIGEQPPENPVTVTFSVTPDNPPCGATFLNEATISDPGAVAPVTVSASTQVVNWVGYFEDFEADNGGYVNMGVNLFTWGPPPQNPQAHSGANAWATGMPYQPSAWYELWSPWIDLSGASPINDLVLEWWQDIYIESASYDHAYVEITTDETNWAIVWQHTGGTYHSPGWEKKTGDITPYIGQNVRLRFRMTTDPSVQYDGWAIDDVAIYGGCQVFLYPDIEVTPLSLTATQCPDEVTTQQLQICNVGDLALDWEISELVSPKGTQAVLWDNGPLVTHPGGGYGGADASALQTALGLSVYGFGHQVSAGNHIADDFTVTDPAGWDIQQITFFAYQSFAPISPSPITGVYYRIWDGPPNDPGSSVVFGDLVTNRLISSTFSNIYRVLDTNLTNTDRAIQTDVATAGVCLMPGTYWLEWMTDGNPSYSGPWVPPISILGQTSTGNALQYTSAGWAPALDGTYPQGIPFVLEGDLCGPPPDLPWLSENPVSGTVPAGECQVVDVTFDSTGLMPDTYTGGLRVASNDPDEPQIDVPVTLVVEPCGMNTMHLAASGCKSRLDPWGHRIVRAYFIVHDQSHMPLGYVQVDASITWPGGGPVQRTRMTKPETGGARFHWGSRYDGPYEFCVDNLTKADYMYNPAGNEVPACLVCMTP